MTLDLKQSNAADLREVLRKAALKSAEVKATKVVEASKESTNNGKAAPKTDFKKEAPSKQEAKNDIEDMFKEVNEKAPPSAKI